MKTSRQQYLHWVLVLPLVSGCSSSVLQTQHGTTYGQIFISSPTVDTRERLINDRNEQYAWLSDQLKKSDLATFDVNGTRHLQSAQIIGASVNANVSPTDVATFHAQVQTKLANLQNQQKLADLDFQIAEAKKELILSNAKKATDPDKITVPDSVKSDPVTSPLPINPTNKDIADSSNALKTISDNMTAALAPTSTDNVPSTPIEQFRDRLAYREEIRNEKITSNLDDRHDLRGNALYRFSFDATVLPADDTGAYAVIAVCAQRHDDHRCDADVPHSTDKKEADRNKRPRNATGTFTDSDAFSLKRSINKFVAEQIEHLNDDILLHSDEFIRTGNIKIFTSETGRLYSLGLDALQEMVEDVTKAAKLQDVSGLNDSQKQSPLARTWKLSEFSKDYNLYSTEVRQKVNSTQSFTSNFAFSLTDHSAKNLLGELCSSLSPEPGTIKFKLGIVSVDDALLRIACMNKKQPDITAINQAIAIYGLVADIKDRLYQNDKTSREEQAFFEYFKNPGSTASPISFDRNNKLTLNLDLTCLVNEGIGRGKLEIYAYGATPKESVQRISDVVSRREGLQLALGLQGLVGNTGLSSLTNFMQANEGIFNSLKRQPLVVGFGHSNAQSEASVSTDSMLPVDFGWIIGPQYGTAKDGKSANFRQKVVQNGLSAVVSIPGWWDSVELVVRRYWVSESGDILAVQSTGQTFGSSQTDYKKQNDITYTIALPDSPDDAFSLINAGQLMDVTEEPRDQPMWELKYGNSAEIVVRGSNLWRNPQVRVGAQYANRIHVMPDMKGVVAIFDKVDNKVMGASLKPFGVTPPKQTLPVTIATPNGFKLVGFAKISEDRPDPTTLRADAGSVIIGGQDNTIALNLKLPGYYSINSIYRKSGSSEAFTADHAKIGNIDNTSLSYTPPSLAKLNDGDSIEMQLLLTHKQGEEPERIPVDGKRIYYKNSGTWNVKATTSTLVGTEGERKYSILLVFPKGYDKVFDIKNGNAEFQVTGDGTVYPASCTIVKSSCSVELDLRAAANVDNVRLVPVGLGDSIPNPIRALTSNKPSVSSLAPKAKSQSGKSSGTRRPS